jgi:hypothetical protein
MKNASRMTVLGLILTTGATLSMPMMASADGIQNTKNMWRNIATGAAVLAGVGVASHNSTDTTIGAIGAAIGLSQYEQARHEQSVQQNGWGNGYDRGYNSNVNIGFRQDNNGQDFRDNRAPRFNRSFDNRTNNDNAQRGDQNNSRNTQNNYDGQRQDGRNQPH